jgi:hypothetical protein
VHPTGIVFSDGASSVIVAGQALAGSSLYSYGDVSGKVKGKPSQPEIQWEHQKIHGMESVLNLSFAIASYGNADGSTIVASCSEGDCFCLLCLPGRSCASMVVRLVHPLGCLGFCILLMLVFWWVYMSGRGC